jgi:hypothetical protein
MSGGTGYSGATYTTGWLGDQTGCERSSDDPGHTHHYALIEGAYTFV